MSFLQSLFSPSEPINLVGVTDFHSHILPGVDDGVQNIETALAILDDYEKAGIKQVWLTTHIMEDVPNTTAELMREFDALSSVYRGNLILSLASENMIDGLFYGRLKNNDVLPIGNHHDMRLVKTPVFKRRWT